MFHLCVSVSLLRRENETLAEKYKNAQASLNSTLSLKARSVCLLHVHMYIHTFVLSNPICDAVEAHSCVDLVAKYRTFQSKGLCQLLTSKPVSS